jgi:hypothetical protein
MSPEHPSCTRTARTYKVMFTQTSWGPGIIEDQYYPGVLDAQSAQAFAVVGPGDTTVPSYTSVFSTWVVQQATDAAWSTLYGVQTEVYRQVAGASWQRVADAELDGGAFTNATGERQNLVLDGDYKILFKKPGYRDVWYGSVATMAAAEILHVGEANTNYALQVMTPVGASAPIITVGASEGQVFTSSASFNVTASDADPGLTAMKVTLDGAVVADLTLDPLSVKTRTVPVSSSVVGPHQVVVTATNWNGVVSSKTVNFTIAGPAPSGPTPTTITIKTSATSTTIGKTPILSGAITTNGIIGKVIVVYVKKPGKSYWTYSSNRVAYSLYGKAAWQYKYFFKKGMAKGVYTYKAAIPPYAGFAPSASPTSVSIRVK